MALRVRPTYNADPNPGMPGAAPAPVTQGVSDRRKLELVESRWRHSVRYHQGTLSRLQRWYDIYRGMWQGRLAAFRNNVNIPFTFAMIQSDVARKVQASFSTWPIVTFEGYAPEDAQRAKKNETLVSAQMKDAGSITRAADFFLQADICGTGIARYGWRRIDRKTRIRALEQVAPGLSIPVVREQMKTIFDGPVWEPVDRLDFAPQPGRNRIEDMLWVEHRYYLDLDDMLEDAMGPDPYFDLAAVKALYQNPMQGPALDEFLRRRVAFRNVYDYQARQQERFSKPVEVIEMIGLVPPEFAPDGIRSRSIAMGNGIVILKDRPNPLGYEKPFASFAPMPDPYSFDGVAKTEVAFGPQTTANRLTNQKLDALDQLIDPMYVANSAANLNTQHLFTRAGRIILVDGAADESNIRALVPNMQGLQAAYAEIGQLFQFMQLGTGETESLLGTGGTPGRETARGFLGRQENALTRLGMETRLAEDGFIEPLADAFRRMDRMWLTLPHQVRILGSLATTNPLTGLPYDPEDATVDFDDLVPDYRARAVGSSQMIGRSIRQQNLVGVLQMMSANPVLLQMVNWANFAKQIFEVFDLKNVDELLVRTIPQVNQAAQAGGTSPQSVAVDTMHTLNQLSPNSIGQLVRSQPGLDAMASLS